MKILVADAIGRLLNAHVVATGYEVIRITRSTARSHFLVEQDAIPEIEANPFLPVSSEETLQTQGPGVVYYAI